MKPNSELEELRARIDVIDDSIAALLDERMQVVEAVRQVKQRTQGGGFALRPAREADILRRLAEKHAFPPGPLIRIWRELLATTTRAQSRLKPAVVVPQNDEDGRTLRCVMDHFGSFSEPYLVDDAGQALDAIQDDLADMAVIPMPTAEQSWWAGLSASQRPGKQANETLRIVGRLPFWRLAGTSGPNHWVLAPLPVERSMADRSVVQINLPTVCSRLQLLAGLRDVGLDPLWIGEQIDFESSTIQHCLDLKGFFDDIQPLIDDALAAFGVNEGALALLGIYPEPMTDTTEHRALVSERATKQAQDGNQEGQP